MPTSPLGGLALLDMLVQSAPIGIAFLDKDFRFVRINESLAIMNGVSVQDHIGRTVAEVLPHLWATLEPIYRSVFETGKSVVGVNLTGETRAAPGRTKHWLVNYHPVRAPEGQILGIGVTVLEETSRKQAEAQVRRLFDEMEHRVRERTAELQAANLDLVSLKHTLNARVRELEEVLSHVRRLQGFIAICMYCKKIRGDDSSWQHLETFISQHSDTRFSHVVCPECMENTVKPQMGVPERRP